MIPVIPPKRQDGGSSFGDLVSYVSVRDEEHGDDLVEVLNATKAKPDTPHRSRFARLVDYATKLREESLISLVNVMDDGAEQVDFYGVTCFHNCSSIETAAEEMEFVASRAAYAKTKSDPVFHYILSWQAHESPRDAQIYDSVRHSLRALGLAQHQFVAAIHVDTENLHVHVAVNRVHPETGYLNRLSYSQEKLHRACRELELKHGFAPDNGCYVIAPDRRIVRRTSAERDRNSAWVRGKSQSLKAYIAASAVTSLREDPARDWATVHVRFAQAGLFLMKQHDELKVMDGWNRERAGVSLKAFGPAWTTEKLEARLGDFVPPAQDIFRQVENVGRFDPEQPAQAVRSERMMQDETLADYAIAKLRGPLRALDADPAQRNVTAVHRLLAHYGLYLQEQHGRLVIGDGYEPGRTPVRAELVWPPLTKHVLEGFDGGWQPVPQDIFRQVTPAERYTGGELKAVPVSDREWRSMRFGSGPQGAQKREIFTDRESLWGYAVSHCRNRIEEMINDGHFTWQRCHELMAREGLLLVRENRGLVVMDAYNRDQTPVKASHVHPDLTLARAEPQAGPFEAVPRDIFERVTPQSRYNPALAVSDRDEPGMKRDPELRRQRREARAAARSELRARYEAFRANRKRPDLNARERYKAIQDECRMRKAHIRVLHRDPLLRKLSYHVVEVQRMQAMIALKETLKAERLDLIGQGKWYAPTYRQWVEVEALKGDRAAQSQLRGWDYRDRRGNKDKVTTDRACVMLCEPGDAPVYLNVPGLSAALQKNGSVRFRHEETGRYVCTDYGDRVVFANASSFAGLQENMNEISPVLFCRNPQSGFAPEGNDEQFNQATAEMVGWYNAHCTSEEERFRIGRPDVDRVREICEQHFLDAEPQRGGADTARYEQDSQWRPPSPL